MGHNRDEERDRPASEDAYELDTKILCSRDGQDGGMVLGVHAGSGNFAALTNIRSTIKWSPELRTSRGRLVEHLVQNGPSSAATYLEENRLDPFHVVAGDVCNSAPALTYTWKAPSLEKEEATPWTDPVQVPVRTSCRELAAGVFVISNE